MADVTDAAKRLFAEIDRNNMTVRVFTESVASLFGMEHIPKRVKRAVKKAAEGAINEWVETIDLWSERAAAASSTGFLQVISIPEIRIEIYSYLRPRELCRLSMGNHEFSRYIRRNIHTVLRHHMPLALVNESTQDSIYISGRHSFTSGESLQDYVVQKIDAAGIMVKDTRTKRESKEVAHQLLGGQNWCHVVLPESSHSLCRHARVECKFDRVDVARAKMIVGIYESSVVLQDLESLWAHRTIMDWLRYLLSMRNMKIEHWHWLANHPNFRGGSVQGTGIMVTTPWGECVEIGWDKKVRIFFSIDFRT